MSVWSSASIAWARSSLPTSVSASRSFTASATSCCWAPSWMFRSIRRRSSFCAATSRRARPSGRRSARRCGHQPGLRGEVRISRSFAGSIGSLAGMRTDSAPRTSSWWRTSIADAGIASSGVASDGHVAPGGTPAVVQPDRRRVGADGRRQDLRHPSSTSSLAYVPATRSENSLSTWYGVARRPNTSRSAIRVATPRSGQTAMPTATPPPGTPYRPRRRRERRARRPPRRRPRRAEQQHREDRVDDLLDHDVDVVEAVLQDRDPDRHGDQDQRDDDGVLHRVQRDARPRGSSTGRR